MNVVDNLCLVCGCKNCVYVKILKLYYYSIVNNRFCIIYLEMLPLTSHKKISVSWSICHAIDRELQTSTCDSSKTHEKNNLFLYLRLLQGIFAQLKGFFTLDSHKLYQAKRKVHIHSAVCGIRLIVRYMWCSVTNVSKS